MKRVESTSRLKRTKDADGSFESNKSPSAPNTEIVVFKFYLLNAEKPKLIFLSSSYPIITEKKCE